MKKHTNIFSKKLVPLLSFFGIGLLGAVVGTMIVNAQDDQIYACVKNGNGPNIRIVTAGTTCNNNETALNWNIQGIPGPTGLPGPTGVPGTGGSGQTVVDSLGQEVGSLFNTGTALRKIGNYWISFIVNPDQILQQTSMQVFYQSSDCSGTSYMEDSLPKVGAVFGNTIYYPGESSVFPYHSYRNFTPPTNSYGDCNDASDNNTSASFGPIQSAQLPSFTPPFSIHSN